MYDCIRFDSGKPRTNFKPTGGGEVLKTKSSALFICDHTINGYKNIFIGKKEFGKCKNIILIKYW